MDGFIYSIGCFVGVIAYIGEEVCMTFYVQDDGRLTFTRKKTNVFSVRFHKEVRVITNDGSNWILDHDPQKSEFSLEDLDYGKETNILINLGSWRIALEGVSSRSYKTSVIFSILCEDW